MSDIFIIVVAVSVIFGARRALYGAVAGTIAAGTVYYLLTETFDLIIFFVVVAAGLLGSTLLAYFSSWFFSGLKEEESAPKGPSIIGGFSQGGTAHRGSGIIFSDEERKGMKPEDRKEKF